MKDLGEHPDGGKITVRDGRYGPYVNHGKINATLPKGSDPMSVTLEQGLARTVDWYLANEDWWRPLLEVAMERRGTKS